MPSRRHATTPAEFIHQWKGRSLSERASAQPHFIALCRLLGVPAPTDNPADDDNYRFDALTAQPGSRAYAEARSSARRDPTEPVSTLWGEDQIPVADASHEDHLFVRVVSAVQGSRGFADVWKRGHFCWEYKRPGVHADLAAALAQLKTYKDSLDNPPLLIVCDIDNFEVHTNFTGYPAEVIRFTIDDLGRSAEEWHHPRFPGVTALETLRRVFTQPDWFRPARRLDQITEDLAAEMGKLAIAISDRKGNDPHDVAHFIMQIVFSLFANDIGLIPDNLVKKILRADPPEPKRLLAQLRELFTKMAVGGYFGTDEIKHFNGGLFRDIDRQTFPKLIHQDVGPLQVAARHDWSAVEPSILGTLFERSLDPAKRSQIGAHYTSKEDILLIVEPVVMAPLRREWKAIRDKVDAILRASTPSLGPAGEGRGGGDSAGSGVPPEVESLLTAFSDRLAAIRILDPACGSGNFLYVAIQRLLDLEKELIAFAQPLGVRIEHRVNPAQLHGIEINDYAAELARVSIWIGYLTWHRVNYQADPGRRPILDALDTIEHRDAILDWRDEKNNPIPTWREGAACAGPAKWPEADFIIGNPPFLGAKLFRVYDLSQAYVAAMYAAYDIHRESDLCCYWFERTRQAVERLRTVRAGLLATQGIRGSNNRVVLDRIKGSGNIFMAWSDRDWILDGAAVHVSIVGFDAGVETLRILDGVPSTEIHASLMTGVDTTKAEQLSQNAGIYQRSPEKGGKFEIDFDTAMALFAQPNPNGRSNSDVIFRWINAEALVSGRPTMWIIDFGSETDHGRVAQYAAPYRLVSDLVKQFRAKNTDPRLRQHWWLHRRTGEGVRRAAEAHGRLLATPMVSKHRIFAWLPSEIQPDKTIPIFARPDDYFFGVLHSAIHEVWARRVGTQLREVESGFRYTPTTCFETFPLPWPPGKEPAAPRARHHSLWREISEAAKELNELRENWLNPPEWIGDVERKVDITYRDQLAAVPEDVRPLVRRSAVMAEAAKDSRLKQRTLTNLYNERPAWVRHAHKRLDRAVLAAYAAIDPQGGWDPDWADVYEPFGAGEIETAPKPGKVRPTKKNRTSRSRSITPEQQTRYEAAKSALAARKPIDEKILANLLRLNVARAASTGEAD